MVVSIHPAGKEDIKRVAQLTQRTNQFNLTTRRYSETDIQAMLQSRNWRIYVLGLKDRFGDNGTVGLAIVEAKGKGLANRYLPDELPRDWASGRRCPCGPHLF